jgi:transposase-like protein
VRNLSTTQVQCDEVWSFCYAKQKNVPEQLQGKTGFGSIWMWTAIDAHSKLMLPWIASDRSQEAADALIADVKARTMMRIQITSDGFSAYIDADCEGLPRVRLVATPKRSRSIRPLRSRA